ncbi:MAG: sugar nucleotide-binding protein [Chloroflexota bacterium]
MKAIITGSSGAVGTALRAHLEDNGAHVIGWDRNRVPVTDTTAMEQFVRLEGADVLFHLATASQPTGIDNEDWIVHAEWTAQLARLTRALRVPFVFTSSVMVFTDDAKGPFTPGSTPDARSGYGYEKLMGEKRALEINPGAVVARLGWQIGSGPGSNNMIDHLVKQQAEHGEIRASRRWYPACSFLADTADALGRLSASAPGLYLLDSNRRWTFYAIVNALNAHHGGAWQVVPDDAFVYDQRMVDPRAGLPSLKERLPALS